MYGYIMAMLSRMELLLAGIQHLLYLNSTFFTFLNHEYKENENPAAYNIYTVVHILKYKYHPETNIIMYIPLFK